MKTRKSITKRFKKTKKGKLLRRQTGLDHCRAKKAGQEIRQRRKLAKTDRSKAKNIKRRSKIR